jgi:hypothetical protein
LKHAAAASQATQTQRVTTSGFPELDAALSVFLLESNVLATNAQRPKLVCNELDATATLRRPRIVKDRFLPAMKS